MLVFVFILSAASNAFSQQDSASVVRITKLYRLSDDYTQRVPVPMDTMLTGFQVHKVPDRVSTFYSSLGNYGLPIEELDFFRRSFQQDEFIYRYYKPYMSHLANKVYVDTQVPFTELVYSYGGARTEAEQALKVRHSQNINRFLNFGLDLTAINSLGQYSYQASDAKSFTIHTSYLGKKYNLFGSWTMNNFTGAENGGISDLSQLDVLATRDLPTNLGGLNNAESVYRYKDLLLIQKYTLGGDSKKAVDSTSSARGSTIKGTFSHILAWENGKKSYSDDSPDAGFYDSTYITGVRNNTSTFDSLYSRVLRNTLRFDFSSGEGGKFQLDIGVGIRNELNLYSQIKPLHDTLLFADTLEWTHSSNAVIGKLSNRIGEKFRWEADGELFFSGYRAGDFTLKGRVEKIIGSGKWESEIYGTGLFVNSEHHPPESDI